VGFLNGYSSVYGRAAKHRPLIFGTRETQDMTGDTEEMSESIMARGFLNVKRGLQGRSRQPLTCPLLLVHLEI
jgi:hypothetical protein